MFIKLDPRRKEPLYRQIFDEVVSRIETRAFPPGFRLPPSRVLARELATHRNTVTRAYGDLEAAGFVSSAVGRGTFVEENAAPAAATSGAAAAKPKDSAEEPAELPWSSLLSRAATHEVLGRADRFARGPDQRDMINLARMQPSPDLVPDELLRRSAARAFAEHGAHLMTYGTPEGLPRLREQIAIDLVSRGVPARADELIVTSGSQQALDLITRALLNPGDVVLVEPTTYKGAIDLFSIAGARVQPVAVDAFGPEPSALERLTRADVKALYVMPNAHNPSGRMMSAERRRALIAWSRRSGVPIIEDDYAAGLELEDQAAPPHLRALDGEVIHVSTFSKRLAPGLRVGYVLAPRSLRPALTATKRVIDLGASLLLQHTLAEFLDRGYLRAHAQRTRREYRERRDALDAALRKALPRELKWQVPAHGLVLWVPLPPELDAQQLYEECLRRGVLVSGSALWAVAPNAEPGVRLGFCSESPERLAEGARRFGKAVKQLLTRTPPRAASETKPIEIV
ncbi:MAG TPA: PLP-dependent aminotransferase family protein [Polyangiales bacterium]|nr:PLP-dependent aminotransferase family protein [Polyangiales bacterium]